MNEIESILIYNNEVASDHYQSHHTRYLITLRSENRSVEYEDLLHEKQIRTLVNYSKFDELFSFAYRQLLDTPKRGQGYHRRFRNLDAYHKWRNSIMLAEKDILWRINIHYADGSFETAIFRDAETVPTCLTRFKNQVKRVLGMKHDRNYHW